VPCPPPLLAWRKIVRSEFTVYRRAVRPLITSFRHSVTPARSQLPMTIVHTRPRTSHNDGSPRVHAVHAANRVMAARRRARNTSPAKMAIFEMRSRRAVHARTLYESISAAWLYVTNPPPLPRPPSDIASQEKPETSKNFSRLEPHSRMYSLERKKVRSESDCFFAFAAPRLFHHYLLSPRQ